MTALNRKERFNLIRRLVSDLRYPYIFILLMVLFLIDLIIPDPILLVDEAILGLLAVLFGMWKERHRVEAEPTEKNVSASDT